MKKLFLLDGMALIYRAFFAMQRTPRFTSTGINTSAVLGFANTLYDLLKNEKPTHIGVAFDTMAPTVRHEGFIEYKANREKMPEDLAASIPYIKRLIEAFNIPQLYVEGYEADDVIGTLAKEAEQAGFEVFMVTPDKDFGQLVSENIFMYKPAKAGEKAVIMGPAEVCEKFGLSNPLQVIDYLGLMGDASDNIPGIKGVGEVTARKLLAEYGSVENLLEKAEEIKNDKLREKVIEGKESAIMSKMLATIILDVPIPFDEKALVYENPDKAKMQELFNELEFRTFGQRIFNDLFGEKPTPVAAPDQEIKKQSQPLTNDLFSGLEAEDSGFSGGNFNSIADTSHQYFLADSREKQLELIQKLSSAPMFCFDTETTGLSPIDDELVGMSFSTGKGEAWYVPVPAGEKNALEILEVFKPLFENPAIGKTGQNMKFDMAMLAKYGIVVKGELFDTMLAHYLLEPDMRHNMDVLSENYLGYKPVSIETLIGKKGKNQLNMRDVEPEKIKEYAAEDADVTFQLRTVFEPKLTENNALPVFREIEMPLIPVLVNMEKEGVSIDKKALDDYSVQLGEEIISLQQQIWTLADGSFNIQSPKQLGDVLYDKLKITDSVRKTTTKQNSTAEDVLLKLAHKHPIVQLVLDYRSLTKLKSTYVDVLPSLINVKTGRVHTSYNQAVAATGRLSSNNPNLQNIPIRTERGREIRKSFVPRNDDFVLLSADYSQIELRIIASVSEDEGMMQAFRAGMDIHTATAAKIYSLDPSEVSKDQRRNAKSVNFGIIYGISAFGLSEQLGIPRREAADIIEQYFTTFPRIKTYMDSTIQSARANGFVETLKGRRRYLRDINSANSVVRGFAERNAINAPIQGTAADMIKLAMINIDREIYSRNLKSRMTLQVHDELVFDCHKQEIDELKSIVKEGMQNALPLLVPVEVEMNTGVNWLEAH